MDKSDYHVLLEFIAKFGVVHERHLAIIVPEVSVNQSVIKKLLKEKYIHEHKIEIVSGAYYTLGTIGAQLMATKAVKGLNFNTLKHDMLLLDLYFDLANKHPGSIIQSERELKIAEGIKIGDKNKFPDLLITNLDGTELAIELEITEKSHARLIEIINNYIANTTLSQIYYFVKSLTLGKKLLALAGYHHKLKVFLLDKNDIMISYTEIVQEQQIPIAKSPWSFDLEDYLTNPKYKNKL
jgi:hypothetical protein